MGHLFPATTVVSTAARPGPCQGPQGGVAILIPQPLDAADVREIIPGCVVEADIRRKGTDESSTPLRGIYLPPDSRREILRKLENFPPRQGSIVVGDLNMQIHAPSD